MCIVTENIKNSKLLILFNTLEERDKDIVLKMTESLVDRWKSNMPETVNNIDKVGSHEQRIT